MARPSKARRLVDVEPRFAADAEVGERRMLAPPGGRSESCSLEYRARDGATWWCATRQGVCFWLDAGGFYLSRRRMPPAAWNLPSRQSTSKQVKLLLDEWFSSSDPSSWGSRGHLIARLKSKFPDVTSGRLTEIHKKWAKSVVGRRWRRA